MTSFNIVYRAICSASDTPIAHAMRGADDTSAVCGHVVVLPIQIWQTSVENFCAEGAVVCPDCVRILNPEVNVSNDASTFRLPDTGVTYEPRKRRNRRMFEEDLQRDPSAQAVMEWFLGFGRFAPQEDGTPHPAFLREGSNNFIDSVRRGYVEWGRVTDGQLAALRRFYDNACLLDASGFSGGTRGIFVGEVGERRIMQLTVEKVIYVEAKKRSRGTIPAGYVNKCRDSDGQCVVIMGGTKFSEGAFMRVRATIKGHENHKGEAQTHLCDVQIINNRRPRRFNL